MKHANILKTIPRPVTMLVSIPFNKEKYYMQHKPHNAKSKYYTFHNFTFLS